MELLKPTLDSVCSKLGRVAIGLANNINNVLGVVHITNEVLEVQESISNEGCFLPDNVKSSRDCS